MKQTAPPARATATAWLAPFPPEAMKNSPPRTVSPGRGIRGVRITMSVLELPMITIFFLLGEAAIVSSRFINDYIPRALRWQPGCEEGRNDKTQIDSPIRLC